jgi:transcriptional regulator with XRE-family HTH domain
MYTQPSIPEINKKLRDIRHSQSLSLADVELLSKGAIKAVVLGSYERGARSLSVKRVLQIANLYQVPISEIFGSSERAVNLLQGKTILDLRLINKRSQQEDRHQLVRYRYLLAFLQQILRMRQDWNGEVISLRNADIATLALLFTEDEKAVLHWLSAETLILQSYN